MIGKCLAALVLVTSAVSLNAGVWDKIKNNLIGAHKPEEPTIKVLIMHDVPKADIVVKGTYDIFDPYTKSKLATRFFEKGSQIEALPSGLKWGEEFPGVYQLLIRPDEGETLTLINGVPYRGNLYVYDIGGAISVVNEVAVEDYLAAMMPAKYSEPLSDEGLAAATIAERTHAYFIAANSQNPYWHVRGADVGYEGYQLAGSNAGVKDAINSTKYMVMSKTGIYDGHLTTFAIQTTPAGVSYDKGDVKLLSIAEIEDLAAKGDNAARILMKKFPNTSIELAREPKAGVEHIAEVKAKKGERPQAR